MQAEQVALLADADASMYAVEGDEDAWLAALQTTGTVPSMVSVKAGTGKSKRQLEQESFATGKRHIASRTFYLLTIRSAKSKREASEMPEKGGKAKAYGKQHKKSKH
jgi:hypothetical protein